MGSEDGGRTTGDGRRTTVSVVVMQLVFALCAIELGGLLLIPSFGSFHGESVCAFGLDGRDGQAALEVLAVTLRTGRHSGFENEDLKLLTARGAAELVDRHLNSEITTFRRASTHLAATAAAGCSQPSAVGIDRES
jgi:hypothetical protein